MRVYLINPPRIHPKTWGVPGVFQPIDIAYVAAFLENHNHRVKILDAAAEGWKTVKDLDDERYVEGLANEEIARRIKQFSPDVVGVNMPFSGWSRTAFEVAATAKSLDRDIPVVMDGVHPSARPKETLANPNIDFAIIGEPELTWLELLESIEKGISPERLKRIKGLGFRQNTRIIITHFRPLIQNLDILPFPARHLLPMNLYFTAVKENPLRGEITKPWTVMYTSRGCPYQCIFCSAHLVRGRTWRGRSPENVIAEIRQLSENYKIKQIDFCDDNMTLDKKRMEKICTLIKENKLDIEWYTPNGVRADTLDVQLLKKMKASGCKRIYVAPESGNPQILNTVIKKNLDLKKVEETVAAAKKLGIKVACFFVIGVIGETKDDIEKTINFAYKLKKLGADKFYFSFAMPLYGTELYEQAKTLGYLKENFSDEALSFVKPIIETPEFTAEELQKLCEKANLVNPVFTKDKFIKAVGSPRKAIKTLLWRIRKSAKIVYPSENN